MAKAKSILQDYRIVVRVLYVAYAVLWWYLNKENIILSQWDADRIGVPVVWYMAIPAASLLLYAIFPNRVIWLFPAAAFVIGWTLHLRKSIVFLYAHMNVKTDWEQTIVWVLIYLVTLATCLTVLYLSGPNIKKRLRCKGNA